MPRHPLIAHRHASDIVAYRRGDPVSAARFLADTERVAASMPPGGPVLNACADRYRFAVGLAAAMVSGKVSVLPANLAPETIRGLMGHHAELFGLTDGEPLLPDLPVVAYGEGGGDHAAASEVAVPDFDTGQAVAWLFTSGSTGEPVAHLKTWGSLTRSVGIEARRLGLRAGTRATVVATVPPQHAYGLESSVLLALHGGFAFSSARPFYPVDICASLAEVPAPRILVSTPFHLRMLLEAGVAVPRIEVVVCATAPLSAALVSAIDDQFGARLVEIFGSTDTGQIASRCPSATVQWHLFDGVRLTPETDRTWASGGHVGAPVVLNDVVALEGDEHFRLVGRSSDLVNVAGKRSSVAFLTHQLTTIPGVVDGAYFMPDEDDAASDVARLAAVVVAPSLDAKQLREALRERVDPVFLPRPLVFVAALPRNDTGKVPRDALRSLLVTPGKAGEQCK